MFVPFFFYTTPVHINLALTPLRINFLKHKSDSLTLFSPLHYIPSILFFLNSWFFFSSLISHLQNSSILLYLENFFCLIPSSNSLVFIVTFLYSLKYKHTRMLVQSPEENIRRPAPSLSALLPWDGALHWTWALLFQLDWLTGRPGESLLYM